MLKSTIIIAGVDKTFEWHNKDSQNFLAILCSSHFNPRVLAISSWHFFMIMTLMKIFIFQIKHVSRLKLLPTKYTHTLLENLFVDSK